MSSNIQTIASFRNAKKTDVYSNSGEQTCKGREEGLSISLMNMRQLPRSSSKKKRKRPSMISHLKSTELSLRNISKEELMRVPNMIQKSMIPSQKLLLARKRKATEERLSKTKPVQTSTTRKEKKKASLNAVRINLKDQNQSTNRQWMQEVRLKLINLSSMMSLCLAS